MNVEITHPIEGLTVATTKLTFGEVKASPATTPLGADVIQIVTPQGFTIEVHLTSEGHVVLVDGEAVSEC